MRHYAFLLLVLVLVSALPLLASCDTPHDELDAFARAQAEVIDRESSAHENASAAARVHEEVSQLNTRLQRMGADIEQPSAIRGPPSELFGPADRIADSQLRIYPHSVQIRIPDVTWSYLLDSNSMDPLLDEGTTVLLVRPHSHAEIQVGDIIVFNASYSSYNVIHRVQSINRDQKGTYYITKGDNNPGPDYEPVRFANITAVVVGILY